MLRIDLWFSFVAVIIGIAVILFSFGYFIIKRRCAAIEINELSTEGISNNFLFKFSDFKFVALISAFAATMFFLVSSDNLIALFLSWETLSVIGYFLVSFQNHSIIAQNAAKNGLFINLCGGTCLLIAVILLSSLGVNTLSNLSNCSVFQFNTNTYELSTVACFIQILFAISIIIKSAQFPFSFWLIKSMVASAPVSAYLHAATLLSAAVYLALHLMPLMNLLRDCLLIAAIISICVQTYRAFFAQDIKILLAHTTIASLGSVFIISALANYFSDDLLLDLSSANAISVDDVKNSLSTAPLMYLLNHSLYKAPLFLVIGYIESVYKSRKIHVLQNMSLIKTSPIALCVFISCLYSMAGFCGSYSSVAKNYIHKTWSLYYFLSNNGVINNVYDDGMFSVLFQKMNFLYVLDILIAVSQYSFVAIFSVIIYKCFLSKTFNNLTNKRQALDDKVFDLKDLINIIPLALSLLLFYIDIDIFSSNSINSSLPTNGEYFVSVIFKVFIFCMATIFTLIRMKNRNCKGNQTKLIVTVLMNLRIWTIRFFSKFDYVICFLLFVLSCALAIFLREVPIADNQNISFCKVESLAIYLHSLERVNWLLIACSMLIYSGIIVMFKSKSRLAYLISLNLIGVGVGLIYVIIGAPDVAITHFMAEIVSTILLVLAMSRMKHVECFADWQSIKQSLFSRDFFIRIAQIAILLFFAYVTYLLFLLVHKLPFCDVLVEQFIAITKHSNNIVNMIITDYRGFDTWGEMTVLGTTCLIAIALLNNSEKKDSFTLLHDNYWVEFVIKTLVFISLFVSSYYLFQGHNIPGGGFISALICVIGYAVIKTSISGDNSKRDVAMMIDDYTLDTCDSYDIYIKLLILGMCAAFLSVICPMLIGGDFFQNMSIGQLSFALLFDFGICVTVIAMLALLVSVL
jgi:multicomponent Na+:H+ antiporter subunit A